MLCRRQGQESGVLTALIMSEGHGADAFRAAALEHFDLSLGNGLSKVADRVFRIGHLRDFNDAMLLGKLSAIETTLKKTGVPHEPRGVEAAMAVLEEEPREALAAE